MARVRLLISTHSPFTSHLCVTICQLMPTARGLEEMTKRIQVGFTLHADIISASASSISACPTSTCAVLLSALSDEHVVAYTQPLE